MAPKKKRKKKSSQQNPGNSAPSQEASVAGSSDTAEQVDGQVMTADAGDAATNSDAEKKPKGPSPVGFVQGTKEELSKVVWPDRQQLISESAAVILMVSFLAIFISLIDNIFSWASRLVF
ncbi:MAG: preprotein translocase subunit SecE [Thermosynechococcaceae cyanobacterium]